MKLLEKDVLYNFTLDCLLTFTTLKNKLIKAPIMIALDWSLPFELMCDTSDNVQGVVLGQQKDNHFHPIYYASKTLMGAQENYTIIEKELLAEVFAIDKF